MRTIYYIQVEKLLVTRSLLLIEYYISFLMNLMIIFLFISILHTFVSMLQLININCENSYNNLCIFSLFFYLSYYRNNNKVIDNKFPCDRYDFTKVR